MKYKIILLIIYCKGIYKNLQEQVKVMLGDFLEKVVDERLKLVLTDTLKKRILKSK